MTEKQHHSNNQRGRDDTHFIFGLPAIEVVPTESAATGKS